MPNHRDIKFDLLECLIDTKRQLELAVEEVPLNKTSARMIEQISVANLLIRRIENEALMQVLVRSKSKSV